MSQEAEALHDFLVGKTVVNVDDSYESEGTFVLELRDETGKVWFARFGGTDMGWWFDTRRGQKGQWQHCFKKEKRK